MIDGRVLLPGRGDVIVFVKQAEMIQPELSLV
jgi:hypothetical protein